MTSCIVADLEFFNWAHDVLGYPTKKDTLSKLQSADKIRLGELYLSYKNKSRVVSEYMRFNPNEFYSSAACVFCAKFLSYDELRASDNSASGEYRCAKHSVNRLQNKRDIPPVPEYEVPTIRVAHGFPVPLGVANYAPAVPSLPNMAEVTNDRVRISMLPSSNTLGGYDALNGSNSSNTLGGYDALARSNKNVATTCLCDKYGNPCRSSEEALSRSGRRAYSIHEYDEKIKRRHSYFCMKCNARLLSDERTESLCRRCNRLAESAEPVQPVSVAPIPSAVETNEAKTNDESAELAKMEEEFRKTLVLLQVLGANNQNQSNQPTQPLEITDKAVCTKCGKPVDYFAAQNAVKNNTSMICKDCEYKPATKYNVPTFKINEKIKVYCAKCHVECTEKDEEVCRGICIPCFEEQNQHIASMANREYTPPKINFNTSNE